MDTIMTTEEQKSRTARSYKLILLFAMVSMTMMFAGLTSAFSKSRADWLKDFQLPTAFFYSTAAMAVVSHFIWQKSNSKKNNQTNDTFPCLH
jgi:cytochrome c oxidase subunit 3